MRESHREVNLDRKGAVPAPTLPARSRTRVPVGMLQRGLALLLLVLVPPLLPSYYLHLVILSFVYAFLAIGVNLLLGEAGLASFGQAAIFGTAAYVVGILSTRYAAPLGAAAGAGVLAALGIAALMGLLVSHLRGDSFLLATLALGMVVWGGAYRWVSMTGGDNGLPGIRRPELLGLSLSSQPAMYYLVLLLLTLTLWGVHLLRTSPLGYSLRGIRENETRLRALGYHVWLHKYLALLFAGLISGLGGVLYAYYNGFVSPIDVHLSTSVQAVLMVVLGGTGTLLGPVIGSTVVVAIRELLSAYTERWTLVLGLLYVCLMLYAPSGLLGWVNRRRQR